MGEGRSLSGGCISSTPSPGKPTTCAACCAGCRQPFAGCPPSGRLPPCSVTWARLASAALLRLMSALHCLHMPPWVSALRPHARQYAIGSRPLSPCRPPQRGASRAPPPCHAWTRCTPSPPGSYAPPSVPGQKKRSARVGRSLPFGYFSLVPLYRCYVPNEAQRSPNIANNAQKCPNMPKSAQIRRLGGREGGRRGASCRTAPLARGRWSTGTMSSSVPCAWRPPPTCHRRGSAARAARSTRAWA